MSRATLAADFPKPRDAQGQPSELPVPEMEKLMLANLPVSETQLQSLAQARAEAARRYLIGQADIDPQRVWTAPADSAAGDDEGPPAPRALFRLR